MGPVVVTGGAGYLGAVVVRTLSAVGAHVVVLDKVQPPGAPDFGVRQIVADVTDAAARRRALQGAAAVVHLAGCSSSAAADADPAGAFRLNSTVSTALAREAAAAGARRFIYASSGAAYGDTGEEVVDEDRPLAPLSTYARSKAAAEAALGAALAPLDVTILRFATLFGKSPAPRADLPLHLMLNDAAQRGIVTVSGAGQEWRSMLHVADAAEAVLRALLAPRAGGRSVLNVAAPDTSIRIAELAAMVADATGARVVHGPSAGRPTGYRLNTAALEQHLAFRPARSVAEGISELSAGRPARASSHPPRLAVHGGPPVRSQTLPVGMPSIGREEEEEVLDTLRSGWLTTGPKVQRFEAELSAWTGSPHVIATSSCTSALQIALAVAGVGPGDEVLVPAITWPSTANVVVHLGARPVLVDVDPTTLCLDPARLPAALTAATRAIVPVHMAGQPVDLAAIWDFAERHGLAVVEDAAHALGASYAGARVGNHPRSAAACLSFYPTKNLTTGEGGALLAHDADFAAQARLMANNGVSQDSWARHGGPQATSHWKVVAPGYKAAMGDLHAAIGLHQVSRLTGFLQRRREIANRYAAAFATVAELEPLRRVPDVEHAWHLFVVLLHLDRLGTDRDGVVTALRAEGIACGIHFRSLHLQPAYAGFPPLPRPELSYATAASARLFSLPLYPAMSDADCDDVIRAVRKVVSYYRRPGHPAGAS